MQLALLNYLFYVQCCKNQNLLFVSYIQYLFTQFTLIVYSRQQLSYLTANMLDYVISFNLSMHQNDKHAVCRKLSSAMQCFIHAGSY